MVVMTIGITDQRVSQQAMARLPNRPTFDTTFIIALRFFAGTHRLNGYTSKAW